MSPATSQAASGAMSYEKIAVHPITTALGAEIEGVDLGRPLDNQTADEVHRALLENLVIFFRGQDMSTEAHKAFARRFGPLNIHPYVEAIPGDPEILEVLKDVDDTRNFGGLWHIDLTFLEKPPLGSVIYAKEVPESGGDTLWSNMTMAYEALSDGMKALLDGLIGVHAALNVYGPKAITGKERRAAMSMQLDQTEKAVDSADHPIVRTHPETGRKCLFLSGGGYLRRFKDMTEEESAPLLGFLNAHAVRPEFTCRFRWENNSVAFWDNRCTQHFALNDYHGQRRMMHRVTIDGDRPV